MTASTNLVNPANQCSTVWCGLPFSAVNPRHASGTAAATARRVAVLTLERQPLWGDLVETAAECAGAAEAEADDRSLALKTSIRIHASIPDLLRAMSVAQEDYLVFSRRPGLIWDRQLVRRVEREIAALEALGIPWFCLSADGIDMEGRQYSAAYFSYEPTLVPDRGRRLIVQMAGTMYVVKSSTLRALGLQRSVVPDLVPFMNSLIMIAYGRGFGSFFTSGLYPCLAEHRDLRYIEIDEQLVSFSPALLHPVDAAELFPAAISYRALLAAWVESLSSALQVKHSFSFVIRTLFRRNNMLQRCLISIEYLRSSLGIPVEIVLASDASEAVIAAAVSDLSHKFPNFTFTVAHSVKSVGHSRVRNLITGLQASAGTRVCIIDDDDYYTPQAVGSFAQACEFGNESLIIFDTQIIIEKWITASVKPHREIVGYSTRFDAKTWATTLRGSNSIPLCGVIHPGWFVRQVAREYVYDFDLSEDFVFHLMCFAHPERPAIKVIEGVCAHQSHRSGDDNVSNAGDRTGWIVDTGNGLYQLLFEEGRTFDVISAARDRMAFLEVELARSNRAHIRATELLAELIKRTTSSAP